MIIHLEQPEMEFLNKKLKRYYKKTGDIWSAKYVLLLLAEKYERTLDQDLDLIVDEKIKEFNERQV